MRITVDTSSEINFGALTMSNGARLKGRLMRESGSPICFEDVILVRTHTAERVDSFQDVNRIVVTTNGNGEFSPTYPLAPGEWSVSAYTDADGSEFRIIKGKRIRIVGNSDHRLDVVVANSR